MVRTVDGSADAISALSKLKPMFCDERDSGGGQIFFVAEVDAEIQIRGVAFSVGSQDTTSWSV